MSKNTRAIVLAGIGLAGIGLLLAIVALGGRTGDDPRNAINQTLIGTNLTYYSIAGKPMNYTIAAGDVKSAESIEYLGNRAWKVRVGQGLAWDLILDAEGKKILEKRQLFNT